MPTVIRINNGAVQNPLESNGKSINAIYQKTKYHSRIVKRTWPSTTKNNVSKYSSCQRPSFDHAEQPRVCKNLSTINSKTNEQPRLSEKLANNFSKLNLRSPVLSNISDKSLNATNIRLITKTNLINQRRHGVHRSVPILNNISLLYQMITLDRCCKYSPRCCILFSGLFLVTTVALGIAATSLATHFGKTLPLNFFSNGLFRKSTVSITTTTTSTTTSDTTTTSTTATTTTSTSTSTTSATTSTSSTSSSTSTTSQTTSSTSSTSSTSTTTVTTSSTSTTSTTTSSTSTTSTTTSSTSSTSSTSTTSTATTSTTATTATTTTVTTTSTTVTIPIPCPATASFPGPAILKTLIGAVSNYSCYSYNWTATATMHTINFRFRYDTDNWYLDDVSIYDSLANQLIQNGGFEGGTSGTANGNPMAVNWNWSGSSCGCCSGVDNSDPKSGTHDWQDGCSGGTDTLSQSFSTTVGDMYFVSWWLDAGSSGAAKFNVTIT
ncbi:unnamed protein product [Adineta ricciae]|uniref:Uncharacterized protein n=1 Tax=Adineta ricciae TaxID=249248 RepID=A0A814BEF6_ADIRI|nr:unnamed protein product [Adineta ricciae]CAF1501707.1 unnamed protein product [Adineta ricciae]